MNQVKNALRARKMPRKPAKPGIVRDELEEIDWDTRVETYPEKPTRIVKVRFIHVQKPPFEFRADEME